jgi:hypothetical protein
MTVVERPPQSDHNNFSSFSFNLKRISSLDSQRIEVYINHFQINYSEESNETILHQFDVDDIGLLIYDG